jgi:hypothetical protein
VEPVEPARPAPGAVVGRALRLVAGPERTRAPRPATHRTVVSRVAAISASTPTTTSRTVALAGMHAGSRPIRSATRARARPLRPATRRRLAMRTRSAAERRAAPDTAIATPSGERAIAELAPGDLVYSVHGSAITVVPISKHQRVPAPGHRVVELELANGRVLHVSAAHPTADGRTLGELSVGDRLDGVAVVSTTVVPLTDGYTVDILPASDTGTYFAGGVLLKSTIAGR